MLNLLTELIASASQCSGEVGPLGSLDGRNGSVREDSFPFNNVLRPISSLVPYNIVPQ
jgi:hypothetical protein